MCIQVYSDGSVLSDVVTVFVRVLYMPSLGYCVLVTVGLRKVWTWCKGKVGPSCTHTRVDKMGVGSAVTGVC